MMALRSTWSMVEKRTGNSLVMNLMSEWSWPATSI